MCFKKVRFGDLRSCCISAISMFNWVLTIQCFWFDLCTSHLRDLIFIYFFQEVRKSLLVSDVWNKSDDSPVTVADYGLPSFHLFLSFFLAISSPILAKCFHVVFNM